jgi:hypothetical protein
VGNVKKMRITQQPTVYIEPYITPQLYLCYLSGYPLKGVCHEMNIFFVGLKSKISTMCYGTYFSLGQGRLKILKLSAHVQKVKTSARAKRQGKGQ